MPFLFLSPSTQTYNPYATNGNEQLWMNRLADEMQPWLSASGVTVTRNDPDGSAAMSIRDSNAGDYDFHLALHSNASPEATAGQNRGIDIYYSPSSEAGLRMANIIVDNLRPLYPLPERVRALPTTVIGEVRRTKAPAVLAELGYHDNVLDESWLIGNLDAVAKALAESVTEYFGLPLLAPQMVRTGTVTLESGVLNLRDAPSTEAKILDQLPNGTRLNIWGSYNGWYTAEEDGTFGFVRSEYITI